MENRLRGNDGACAAAETLIRAAQYLRKSTDHQRYSTENQSETNHGYADRRGIQIVRTYVDDGISGLSIEGRDALQQLIEDVQSGSADFTVILVYDVSRWGRFQDVDESAYYEYLCKHAGVRVHYCAESFENDGSPISSLVKALKRAMAGEYSRELSVKVFAGQSRVMKLGFTLGGIAGYGLRRQLVDRVGVPKCLLAPGEWKSIATDRVLLIPGPAEELENIRGIYSSFAREGKNEAEIANALNQQGVPHHLGKSWTAASIRDLLRSEKYIGNQIWNRKSSRLKRKTVLNSPELWVRVEGAFEAIVERSLFDSAQAIFRARTQLTNRGRPRGLSNAEMVDRLAQVFRAHGRLSHHIIDHSEGLPSCSAYAVRFGRLTRAYDLVGFKKDANQYGRGIEDRRLEKEPRGLCDDDMLDALRRLLRERGYLSRTIIDACKDVPSTRSYCAHFGTVSRAYELIGYKRLSRPRPRLSNEQMLEALDHLWKSRGNLSKRIINAAVDMPSCDTFGTHFGGLLSAYKLIGFTPKHAKLFSDTRGLSNEKMLARLAGLLRTFGFLSCRLVDRTQEMPSRCCYANRFGSFRQACTLVGYDGRRRR